MKAHTGKAPSTSRPGRDVDARVLRLFDALREPGDDSVRASALRAALWRVGLRPDDQRLRESLAAARAVLDGAPREEVAS